MQYIKQLSKTIFSIYAFICFIFFLFLIFPLVIIASFFDKKRGGNFIYTLCKIWSIYFLFVTGINVKIINPLKLTKNKNYVFVFNHISYLDIPLIMIAIKNYNFRILGKAEMTKIPIFGFIYKKAVVSVERENLGSRVKSLMQLKNILLQNISIVVSPEGTFNMTNNPLKNFYDGAFKVAIETQTSIKPILFLDAYDRYNYKSIFSLNPGNCRIVYLDEISVKELTNKDVKFLKEKVYSIMEEKLLAYKASWIK